MKPLPSPDGAWLAFFGREDWEKPRLTDRYALSVMRPDGSARRVLNVEDGPLPVTYWMPDSRRLVTWKAFVNDDDGEPESIEVREWDVAAGTYRLVANLNVPPLPPAKPRGYQHQEVESHSLAHDGHYLFFTHTQMRATSSSVYLRITRVWHALRLADGKLFTLATLRGSDFDWHDESLAAQQ